MIVGTAGHIDHGKTALVRALTGVETDRLKEEKARGISIELGYAYTALENGDVLGFVDVPGHERLVHTMVAGATGIDFALLVVAAVLLFGAGLFVGWWFQPAPPPAGTPSFQDFMLDALDHVNSMQQQADLAVEQLMTGGEVNPAEVLTAVQKADLSFRMMLQIRNKLVSAWQEVNNIRI